MIFAQTKLRILSILVQGEGFEPPNSKRPDLQSGVFNRFTTPAYGADGGIRTHDPLFTKQPL